MFNLMRSNSSFIKFGVRLKNCTAAVTVNLKHTQVSWNYSVFFLFLLRLVDGTLWSFWTLQFVVELYRNAKLKKQLDLPALTNQSSGSVAKV